YLQSLHPNPILLQKTIPSSRPSPTISPTFPYPIANFPSSLRSPPSHHHHPGRHTMSTLLVLLALFFLLFCRLELKLTLRWDPAPESPLLPTSLRVEAPREEGGGGDGMETGKGK
ncbi:MAG: hypothetical protein LQ338_007202, partial [Usnochroma carphineum]